MLRSTELNTFSMTKTIYRDLVCRANGGIYRLSGKTPWRYDSRASCMSKQSVTMLHLHLLLHLLITKEKKRSKNHSRAKIFICHSNASQYFNQRSANRRPLKSMAQCGIYKRGKKQKEITPQ